MNRSRIGRIMLSAVLIGGASMSFLLDWSSNHLLNPLWHAHARYHSAILLFFFAGTAAVGTWLLWRPSRDRGAAVTAASLLSLSYWTPFFYVPLLLPAASYWAGVPGHEPHWRDVTVLPNLVVVFGCVVVTVVGWWFARQEPAAGAVAVEES